LVIRKRHKAACAIKDCKKSTHISRTEKKIKDFSELSPSLYDSQQIYEEE
jgi:hypothetical protein